MKIRYTKCPTPIKRPCLMQNEFGEVFFVTDGLEGKIFVTRINSGAEELETWESTLKDYKPLPKGAKFEFIN